MSPFPAPIFVSVAVYPNWNVGERDTQAKHRRRGYVFSEISHQVLEETVRYGDTNWVFPLLFGGLTACSLEANP